MSRSCRCLPKTIGQNLIVSGKKVPRIVVTLWLRGLMINPRRGCAGARTWHRSYRRRVFKISRLWTCAPATQDFHCEGFSGELTFPVVSWHLSNYLLSPHRNSMFLKHKCFTLQTLQCAAHSYTSEDVHLLCLQNFWIRNGIRAAGTWRR